MKTKKRKIPKIYKITVIFAITLFFMSVGFASLEQNLSLSGAAYLTVDQQGEEADITPGNPSSWQSGGNYTYQYQSIAVSYAGSEPTSSWLVELWVPIGTTVGACWNAICSVDGTTLSITNTSTNAIINPNQTFTIGFQITTTTPYEFTLLSTNFYTAAKPNPKEMQISTAEGLILTLTPGSGWNSGTNLYTQQYDVVLRNNSTHEVFIWEIAFNRTPEMRVVNGWSSSWITQNDRIIFTPAAHNFVITPNSQISFGFQLERNTANTLSVMHHFGKVIMP